MKATLTAMLIDMAKGINPKTQNLLDKKTGTELTERGEEVVHTTIAVIGKRLPDDVVCLTNRVIDYRRPSLNGFALMDFSHRVGFSIDKAKAGQYVIETGANLEYDEDKLIAPSVYAENLNMFLQKCGFKETCDVQVTKAIRTWADVNFVLNQEKHIEEVVNEDGEPDYVATYTDELMLVEGKTPTERGLLEAQLLKLRPKFDVELFADYHGKLFQDEEIILWAKSSAKQNQTTTTQE